MKLAKKCICVLLLLMSAGSVGAFGWERADFTTISKLRDVIGPAGYVFAGRVTAIAYVPPKNSSEVATMRITFRVEQAVRGTQTGANITIRQWVGLWNSGERYRVGERVVLFLYPRSKLGLTSAVGGARGRFTLTRDGQVLLPATVSEQQPGPIRHDRVPLREFVRSVRQMEMEK
jgi:hypothetical protein